MATMKDLVLPSAVSLAVPLALITNIPELQGKNEAPESAGDSRIAPNGILVFFVGLASLIFVPVFKVRCVPEPPCCCTRGVPELAVAGVSAVAGDDGFATIPGHAVRSW
eukprot:scaffold185_cov321-Prasinococcus_capsulatus_cf.AAC.11